MGLMRRRAAWMRSCKHRRHRRLGRGVRRYRRVGRRHRGHAGQALTVATEGNGATCLPSRRAQRRAATACSARATLSDEAEPDVLPPTFGRAGARHHARRRAEALAQGLGCAISHRDGRQQGQMSITEPTSDPEERNAEYHELENSYAFGYFAIGKNKDVRSRTQPCRYLEEAVASSTATWWTTAPARRWSTSCRTPKPAPHGHRRGGEKGSSASRASAASSCLGGFEHKSRDDAELPRPGAAVPAAGSLNTGARPSHLRADRRGFLAHEQRRRILMAGRDLRTPRRRTRPSSSPRPLRHHRWHQRPCRFYMDFGRLQRAREGTTCSGYERARGLASRPHAVRRRMAALAHAVEGRGSYARRRRLAQGAISAKWSGRNARREGYAYAADTIEELRADGSAGRRAATTVDQWNECRENGKDIFFHRPESTLVPVKTPCRSTRAAVRAVAPQHRRRPRARCQRRDRLRRQPIPGLYSAGEFGSIWGHYYEGGGNVAGVPVFGRASSAQSAIAAAPNRPRAPAAAPSSSPGAPCGS